MQKIKYIVIFTLLLALGILYVQLSDYDKITNALLNENSSSYKNIENLNNKIILLENKNTILNNRITSLENNNSNLNNTITQLQEEIIAIDENLSISNLPIQQYTTIDTNTTINNSLNINEEILLSSKKPILKEEESIQIEPKIQLDDQNNITGFGIEYKEEF